MSQAIQPQKIFDTDPYPGQPKILFIGLAESSHTHSWVGLLDGVGFNVRMFAIPTIMPPADFKIRTYVAIQNLGKGIDPDTRSCLCPTPEEIDDWEKRKQTRLSKLKLNPLFFLFRAIKKSTSILGKLIKYPYVIRESNYDFTSPRENNPSMGLFNNLDYLLDPPQMRASSPEEWLAQIIREWQPDIIHTLGVFDMQGGEFYYSVRKKYRLEGFGKWVLQLRGGSDLTLRQFDPEIAPRAAEIMQECDQILSDNSANIHLAERLSVSPKKFASIIPVPGTGGIDIDSLTNSWESPPNKRRMILWPKSYECIWSKAIPVFEAIKIAWEKIQPCEINILAANPETRSTFYSLPDHIRRHCHLFEKLDRREVLILNLQARVALMPSLIDGVPNCLFEAMAAGAFPIVSPLDTIVDVVESEKNVLFARNLYPDEIASALIRAMNDEVLIENATHNNLKRVRYLADRNLIQKKVIDFYTSLIDN